MNQRIFSWNGLYFNQLLKRQCLIRHLLVAWCWFQRSSTCRQLFDFSDVRKQDERLAGLGVVLVEEVEGCLGWIKVISTRTRWQKKIRWISLVHKLDVPRFNSVAPNRRIVVSTEGVPRPQKLAFIAHWLLSILHRLQAITSTDAGIK